MKKEDGSLNGKKPQSTLLNTKNDSTTFEKLSNL